MIRHFNQKILESVNFICALNMKKCAFVHSVMEQKSEHKVWFGFFLQLHIILRVSLNAKTNLIEEQ